MYKHLYKLAVLGAAIALFSGAAFAQNHGSDPAPASQAGSGSNMFGGPIYSGAPALNVTAALVKAGGGAENFEFSTALVSMLGEKTVNAEVAKLTKQYGKDEVNTFLTGMTYAVKDGLKRATEAGVKLPAAPADLHGVALARTLVTAGTAPDGMWWSGYLFDHALSHDLHNQVMEDINSNVSTQADLTTHKILNQAMFDVAHALGHKHVKLATLH
ncbi:MAG: hypothetical protein KGJ17_02210 [Gammaproteobacteria bacterium]|nr:hypothetical protein [Gammaproteobacteria bacterium]MDE2024445.1 hypothetical protein [Gammaproteobacteria bacterium]MDE2139294.1 hypothetical protein [Gammaproteobacteria bacterium]